MSTAEGRSRPRLNHAADTKKFRRYFIGGSDARIITGNDEAALIRLWREKRGEMEPEDLSGNLVVQLGVATEELNRRWYQVDVQRKIRHPVLRWMGATLDGRVQGSDAVFEGKFMLPCRSRMKRRPRNTCPSCSIICGWWRQGPRCCQ